MTFSGSVNLALAGIFLGIASGIAYALLQPLQVGPPWFQTLSISVGAGVVVGAMLVNQEGMDFYLLDPAWLAAAMFVAIPVLHVALLDLAGRRLRNRFAVSPRARTGWLPVASHVARAGLAVVFVLAVVDLARDVRAIS